MKWSQGVCASILIDGLYPLSPPARSHPRLDQDFPGSPGELAFTPNALAADWRLSPQAGKPSASTDANAGGRKICKQALSTHPMAGKHRDLMKQCKAEYKAHKKAGGARTT